MNKLVIAAVVLLAFSACVGHKTTEKPLESTANMDGLGYVWMMPKSGSFIELLDNDKLDQWQETLAAIDIIGYADHVLFGSRDEDMRLIPYPREVHEAVFEVMNQIGLPLALEVGAVKPWGRTGLSAFTQQNNSFWKNFIERGATIAGIVMDEPLSAVFNRYDTHFADLIPENTPEAKFEYAIEETAYFMQLVREEYPDWFIACIGVYPNFDADETILWIDALEARLAEKGVRGQEFFRLDVDWNAFGKNYTNALGQRRYISWERGWSEVKRIEDHCRSIGLPFSLVYWAADVAASPVLRADPASWLNSILQMGQRYQNAGGRPDQYVIQTWIPNIPEKTLPETDPHSFTYSVVEFNRQFIPPYPHGGDQ